MNDPERITRSESLARDLLVSARNDRPSDHARKRTAVAIGLAASGIAAVTTANAATAVTSKVGMSAGFLLVAKSVIVGTACCAVIASGMWVVRSSSEPAVSVVAPRTVPQPTTRPEEHLAAPAASSSTPLLEIDLTPPALPTSRASAHANPGQSAPADHLTEEIRNLDDVRSRLESGDARGALDALDAYDRKFDRRSLSPEAEALRIQALYASGDRAKADARARAFLATNANNSQARRIRALLDDAK